MRDASIKLTGAFWIHREIDRARKPLSLVAAISASLALSACHMTLVTDYDDTFDQELTATQQDLGSLLDKLINDPSPANPKVTEQTFSANADAVAAIRTDVQTLSVRAAAHSNNGDTVASVEDFSKSFNEFAAEFATPGITLDIEHVRNVEKKLNHQLSALMAEELLKKAGVSSGQGTGVTR